MEEFIRIDNLFSYFFIYVVSSKIQNTTSWNSYRTDDYRHGYAFNAELGSWW